MKSTLKRAILNSNPTDRAVNDAAICAFGESLFKQALRNADRT